MQKHTALFHQLQQHIAQFKQQTENLLARTVNQPFAKGLFSEEKQSLADYIAEMEQSLQRLQQMDQQEVAQFRYQCDHFLTQFRALQDVVATWSQPVSARPSMNFNQGLSRRQQLRQAIDQLPPRERLVKYYEALHALNDKLNQQRDAYHQAKQADEKNALQAQMEHTRQRRARCLEAIELLEDYLTFKQQQAQGD